MCVCMYVCVCVCVYVCMCMYVRMRVCKRALFTPFFPYILPVTPSKMLFIRFTRNYINAVIVKWQGP